MKREQDFISQERLTSVMLLSSVSWFIQCLVAACLLVLHQLCTIKNEYCEIEKAHETKLYVSEVKRHLLTHNGSDCSEDSAGAVTTKSTIT